MTPLYYTLLYVWLCSLDPHITPPVAKRVLDAHIVWHGIAHNYDSEVNPDVCKGILLHDIKTYIPTPK